MADDLTAFLTTITADLTHPASSRVTKRNFHHELVMIADGSDGYHPRKDQLERARRTHDGYVDRHKFLGTAGTVGLGPATTFPAPAIAQAMPNPLQLRVELSPSSTPFTGAANVCAKAMTR